MWPTTTTTAAAAAAAASPQISLLQGELLYALPLQPVLVVGIIQHLLCILGPYVEPGLANFSDEPLEIPGGERAHLAALKFAEVYHNVASRDDAAEDSGSAETPPLRVKQKSLVSEEV